MMSQELNQTTPAKRTRRFARATTVMAFLTAALSGCAGLGTPQPPELTVRQLATQRWQALLAQDFAKAYTFAAPSYRQLHNEDTYRKNHIGGPVKWLAAKVLRVQCDPMKCNVRIELESQPLVPFAFKGTINTGLDETWVFENGQWWMLEEL